MEPIKSGITLEPEWPVEISVDFQSLHPGAFQLSIKDAQGAWSYLKSGSSDATVTVPSAHLKQGLRVEYLYFPAGSKFRASLVIRHGSQNFVIPTDADDKKTLESFEVSFK